MNLRVLLGGLTVAVSPSFAQLNMSLLGHLDYDALHNSDLSNLWGYTDEFGNEYALVGVNGTNGSPNTGGLSVVDVTDPANPVEVFFHASSNSIWREIKTWGDYAYVTTEAEVGLMIVDLSPLPQSTNLPVTVFQGNGWTTSHSLFIDENGRLYLNGSDRGNGGVIMYDLTGDPMAPVEVGAYDPWYCHDCFARGDTLYAGHIYEGFFSMVDVSDPANPVLLGTQNTPDNFTHNVWLDASGQHLFTTDERTNAFVGSYDVSDPTDIQFLDKLQSDPGSGTIPHNTYWLNDYLVTSYYSYGVVAYDAHHPGNLVEVGHYDTSPFSGDGFNGAWGVYPFLPSGHLLVSDIQQGLFVVDPTYVPACWLEGTVTDAQTTAPLFGAIVTILGTSISDQTTLIGGYTSGYHTPGPYDVQFSRLGYFPQTITGVMLTAGQVTQVDVALVPLPTYTISGQVVDSQSGQGIADARVDLKSPLYHFTLQADANGQFTLNNVYEDTYTITAGQWGWRTDCSNAMLLGAGTPTITIPLDSGYYDDFVFDFNWQVSGTASSGMWERGEPVGTDLNGEPSNPGADADADCGTQAYVTGNGGGSAGNDDVDDGYVQLVSPMFDASSMPNPHVRYHRWYFNGGGSGTPNDTLIVSVTNGISTVVVETVTSSAPDLSQWVSRQFRIADFVTPTANMQLRVRARDGVTGHIVEGGLDRFEVIADPFAGIAAPDRKAELSIAPNPSDGRIVVHATNTGESTVEVIGAGGRSVAGPLIMRGGVLTAWIDAAPGVYIVRVTGPDGSRSCARWVHE